MIVTLGYSSRLITMLIPICRDARPAKVRTHVALLYSFSWHTCGVNREGRMHTASHCMLLPGRALHLLLLSILLVVKLWLLKGRYAHGSVCSLGLSFGSVGGISVRCSLCASSHARSDHFGAKD